ncbi:50S ribosomal protein L23 [Candidatus Kaiserbacteria bacterium]|nr:50S ribosomal protein L23 [Candidatus Kaiserbacteria bacterium]
MALFRLKKDIEEKKTSKDVVVSDAQASGKKVAVKKEVVKTEKEKPVSDVLLLNYKKDIQSVLKHPRVTEKATLQSEKGVYVFDVAPRATKKEVIEAVKVFYKVTPRKVNIVNVPSKKVNIRGKQNKYGVKSGGKKAYIYVKKGDTIDIV